MKLHFLRVIVHLVCLRCIWLTALRISMLLHQRERKFINIGETELLKDEIKPFLFFSYLLRCERYNKVRVSQLFILLHHFKLYVYHLKDAIEDHVVVKVKLLIQIVLFLKLIKLLCRFLHIVKVTLKCQMCLLNNLMNQRSLLSKSSRAFAVYGN